MSGVGAVSGAAASFWTRLARPIVGLAPMDGVSDQPFRYISNKYGRPDVTYTEFTSVDELCRGRRHRALRGFIYDESQRPVVAQVYGRVPDHFRQAAVLVCALGFDGIDINMGCPAKSVANGGSGAGLIRTPGLAQEIVRATQLGVRQWCDGMIPDDCPDLHASVLAEAARRREHLPAHVDLLRRPIPVSVKTRTGYDTDVADVWIPTLLETEPAAIALHGRTLAQRYAGAADWDAIGRAARHLRGSTTLLLGNGDVSDRDDGEARAAAFGLDGVLIGRAAMGDPFVLLRAEDRPDLTALPHGLWTIAVEHAHVYAATFGHEERYHFDPIRKHLSSYWRKADRHVPRRLVMNARTPAELASFVQRKAHVAG
ncbi:MAG: tRNA-dihydrouridine synthase family protein [Caldilineaceae bacterium]